MSARVFLCALAFTAIAQAHAGQPLEPHDLARAWRFDPGVVIPLLIAMVLYARGCFRARRIAAWQIAAFWLGIVFVIVALVSPLHPLGEVLFSAHMVQHEVLMLLAAPLLVLARPMVPMLWALPFEARRSLGRWAKTEPVAAVWRTITKPSIAWTLHAAAIWLWHAPAAFQATLNSDWIHTAQHVSFFGTALLFWWSLFHERAQSYGAGVLYLFTTAVHTSILGALLTFAREIWYPAYALTAPDWGFTVLEDQQTGGLIMWVPGSLVYLAAGLVLFLAWLRESEAMAQRRNYAA